MRKQFASLLLSMLSWSPAWATDVPHLPQGASFFTLVTTPLAIEGLTGDREGNLYTTGRNAGPGVQCPVWRISLTGLTTVVGYVPAPSAAAQCLPTGIAFGANGNLFISDGDRIYTVKPDVSTPPIATTFAVGVPGTNGLAFDRYGNLWTGDGATGQGRVWRVSPGGAVVEVFRVQPMANEVNLNSGVGGVGRDARTLPAGTITVTPTTRNAANMLGSQPFVANGVAFDNKGDMYVADTARGAIWRVEFNRQGNLRSATGCDTTFTANTLCLDNILVAHPFLEGADGIALDRDGNIWVDAGERNAVVFVTRKGRVVEVFRNSPDAATKLRNGGPLEFPSSPFLSGDLLCTANADFNRRDNAPSTVGELGGSASPLGKISCLDQRLHTPGLPLPVK